MNITDLLTKLLKGESLTDEEKDFAAKWNPNDTAAAARKKAEERLKASEDAKVDLQRQLDELREQMESASGTGKSELEKTKAALEKATKQLQDMQTKVEGLNQEKADLVRNHQIDRIFGGIQFVDGIERDMIREVFARKFSDMKDEDLADESAVKPVLEAFTKANKAIIADNSGHGSGHHPHDGRGRSGSTEPNPFSKKSFNLTAQGRLVRDDPQKAQMLREQAAAEDKAADAATA